MKPAYELSRSARHNVNPATKTRQIEAWLAGLPDSDEVRRADLLADYLAEHDRLEVPAAFRTQLLKMVSPAVDATLRGLEAEVRDLPLPTEAGQFRPVNRAIRLLMTVGTLNKRLILEFADYSPRPFGKNPLPAHILGFLNSARRVLDICYSSHSSVPQGLWRDIHQTGLLIFAAGLIEEGGPGDLTPMGVYKAILLDSAADPYHFSSQERLWLRGVVTRLGYLARVDECKSSVHKGIYGIRAGEDRPPYPLAWQEGGIIDCDLVLDTADLAHRLALLIYRMEKGEETGLPGDSHPSYKALLQNLKLLWSGQMRRMAPRRPPVQARLGEVLLGFDKTQQFLAGGGVQAVDAGIPCQVVNESLGGMALQVREPEFNIKIGTLVLVGRRTGESLSELGLVRWYRVRSDGVLTFGVKLLPGRPRCVTVLPGDHRRLYPGLLLLPEKISVKPGGAASCSLILPSVRIDAKSNVEIRLASTRLGLQLMGNTEGLNGIELFRCRCDKAP